MMPIRPIIVMLSAMAAFDARAISAQTAGATQVASAAPTTAPAAAVVLVDGKPIGAAEAWGAKPADGYDVVLPMADGMIASLSIGNEAGKLVGNCARAVETMTL